MARPSKYRKALADKICDAISTTTLGLSDICDADESLPDARSVYRWLNRDEEFRQRYARAKELQVEAIADEMLAVADDGRNDWMTIKRGQEEFKVEDKEVTNRSKLRIDTRKWLLSKLAPKKYGEKLALEHSGEIGIAERIARIRERKLNADSKRD